MFNILNYNLRKYVMMWYSLEWLKSVMTDAVFGLIKLEELHKYNQNLVPFECKKTNS